MTSSPPDLAALSKRLCAAFPPRTDVTEPSKIAHKRIAAVLVPLFVRSSGATHHEDDLRVLLTLRSSRLASHPGEVAFPGGKWDASDETLIATALREASEEIGLPSTSVQVVCVAHPRLARNSIAVYPVIALISPDFVPALSPAEVTEVFDVPLAVFIRQRAHVHNDISYFGTPSFRVHTFACVPTIALSLGPTVALGIEEALRTGSFVEDKEVVRRVPHTKQAISLVHSVKRLRDLVSAPSVPVDEQIGAEGSTASLVAGAGPGAGAGAGAVSSVAYGTVLRKHLVFGLTAGVLIQVASAAFVRPAEFELTCPGGMFWAVPVFDALSATEATPTSKL